MSSNIDKYKKDLDKLLSDGFLLLASIWSECEPEKFKETFKNFDGTFNNFPNFKDKYQSWYSESLAIIKALLPNRLNDFIRYYERPKSRKEVNHSNYVIEDYFQGLSLRNGNGKIVASPSDAIPMYQQQYHILKSLKNIFESSLYNLKQSIQVDIYDSELRTAKELNKEGFVRAAGAVSGVVLAKHLSQVCSNHSVSINMNKPSLSDYYQLLKDNNIIDTNTGSLIQHLSQLRNLVEHNNDSELTKEQVADLIAGTDKIIKTVY